MSTSLATLRVELSKQIDDYWAGTTSSKAASLPTYTLVDTALSEKQSDWVSNGSSGNQPSTLLIVSAGDVAPEGEERVVSSLTTSSLKTTSGFPFTADIDSGDTYEIHRLFTAAEKERAIQYACYASFPALYKQVHDKSISFGNWLKNGDFEIWTLTTTPDHWTVSGAGATVAEDTTTKYVKRGSSSAKITLVVATSDAAALHYSSDNIADLRELAGRSITLKAWCYAIAADFARVRLFYQIYGAAANVYSSSDFHDGDSTWRELECSLAIPEYVQYVGASLQIKDANGSAYFDDARLIGIGEKYGYDISDLGLYLNQPHEVWRVINRDYPDSNMVRLTCWEPPSTDGKLRFTKTLPDDSQLVISGLGYLTQPTSTVSTDVDAPQTQIIVAEAAVYLYDLLINRSPIQEGGRFEAAKARWQQIAKERRAKYGMPQPYGTLLR